MSGLMIDIGNGAVYCDHGSERGLVVLTLYADRGENSITVELSTTTAQRLVGEMQRHMEKTNETSN